MIDMNTVTDEQADYMNTPMEAVEEVEMLKNKLKPYFPNELEDYLETDFCERVARRMVWDIPKGFAKLPERFRAIAFHHAVLTDDIDVVEYFIRAAKKAKMDVDTDFCDPEYETTPMMRACCSACKKAFIVLVETGGASLSGKDKFGRSLAFCCLCSGNLPFMMWAQKRGIEFDVNNKVDALIPNAGEDGWFCALKWLIEKLGGDVNATDKKGHTALYYANLSEADKSVRWLIEKGADASVLSEDDLNRAVAKK